MRALFPISVDNQFYRTEFMYKALLAGMQELDTIYFLIADEIQVYNEIANVSDDTSRISAIDWSGGSRHDLEERRRWLEKVRLNLPNWPNRQKWRVLGFKELSDWRTIQILRSLRVLYSVDENFRDDVDSEIHIHLKEKITSGIENVKFRLCLFYLMEEIAINLRVRAFRFIYDEYYLGRTILPLIRLYKGKYIKNVTEITNFKRSINFSKFNFYTLDFENGWECCHWKRVHD